MNWRETAKIDAHVHILPKEVHIANPDADDAFSFAHLSAYQKMMDQYHIHKAIIMPLNDPWLMSMDFTVEAVHRNLLHLCETDQRFSCFADVDIRNSADITCGEIQKAMRHSQFLGIKLHPDNSGMNIDDAYNDAIAEFALKHDLPVAIHSYPSSTEEGDRNACCAPERIAHLLNRHPGLKVIVCHLGGFQWEDAVQLDAYFDISAILPDLLSRYGIIRTNEILREFGPDRLLFATDWPCSRSVQPEKIMEVYFDILDQMDFTEEEKHRIAFANAERLFYSGKD